MNQPAEILPGFMWLCGVSGRKEAWLKEKGITLVINATKGCPRAVKCSVRQIKLNCDDTPAYDMRTHFHDVNHMVNEEREKKGKVLIHCIAGVSRSASLVLAYLVGVEKMTLFDAHTLVKRERPIIRPNPGFWGQLVELEKEVLGTNTVTMVLYGNNKLDASLYEHEYKDMVLL